MPAALISHLHKSEYCCEVRRRDGVLSWVPAVLTDDFGCFSLVSPDNAVSSSTSSFPELRPRGPFQSQSNGPEVRIN
jgi:hypothetical protein